MQIHNKFISIIFIFLALLFGATIFYSQIEGWRLLDSLYFSVATVTTIGYGDIAPVTDAGKIFTIFFAFMGIGLTLYFFTIFGKYIYKKQLFSRMKDSEKLRASRGIRKLTR